MTLPNFIIIGAAKSGTTSLAVNLADHPDVYLSRGEKHFFSDDANWRRGRAWYQDHFVPCGPAKAVGEKSPSYLYEPRAVPRLAELYPEGECLFIAILREPTARALSHVEHRRRQRAETRTAAQAIGENLLDPRTGYDYVGRGLYASQLERYVEAFGADALHVEFFEDLARDPVEVFTRISDRLGLRRFVPPGVSVPANRSARIRYPRLYRNLIRVRAGRWLPRPVSTRVWRMLQEPTTYRPLPDDLRRELRSFYDEPNEALATMLGRPLPVSWTE